MRVRLQILACQKNSLFIPSPNKQFYSFNLAKRMIDPGRIICIAFFAPLLLLNSACLNRHFIEGRVEIVSSSDTALNDSSLIFGQVYHVDWSGNEYYLDDEFEIWIENSDLRTTNDTRGYYSLQTVPGTYTIKCQSTGNSWERLIEEAKEIDLSKNTKTEIDFYIGYTIE